MNHLYSHPEMMMGIAMFGLVALVALFPLALAAFSKEEDDGQ